jgi:hypothetical protein
MARMGEGMARMGEGMEGAMGEGMEGAMGEGTQGAMGSNGGYNPNNWHGNEWIGHLSEYDKYIKRTPIIQKIKDNFLIKNYLI